MRRAVFHLMTATAILTGSTVYAQPDWSMVGQIEKNISAPVFRNVDYVITGFGAVAGGREDALPAIRRAIDKCTFEGGGRVVVPAGNFFVKGPIALKSNVNLHLEKDAELIFSSDSSDYLPVVLTRWEGTEVYNYSPLVYAYQVKNIAITGRGTLNGQGSKCFSKWSRHQRPDQQRARAFGAKGAPVYERVFGAGHWTRPSFIQPLGCSNVLIEGVKIIDSPFYLVHLVLCENVTVRGVDFDSTNSNNDGCNPESCLNVLIEDCVFKTGNDCIAIKSGRDRDAWRMGQPTQNLIIRNCSFESRANALVFGSELSGGIRNVFAENIEIKNVGEGIYFKSNMDRGGYCTDVAIRNVKVVSVRGAVVRFNPDYSSGGFDYTEEYLKNRKTYPTLFRNIVIENVDAENAGTSGINILGVASLPIENVIIRNFNVKKTPVEKIVENARNVRFEKVVINGKGIK